MCDTYGLHFKETMDLDIGLKYQALNQGQIDVMVIFTTDGQLSASDAVVLEDDLHFYPSYLCGNVIRNEVLESHPELKEVFDKLTGKISDSDMARMNYEVETEAESRGMWPKISCGNRIFCSEEVASMKTAIAFQHVKKAYGEKTVLRDFCLSIKKGEFVTIIGSSGCGKTTALKMVNGLLTPDQGENSW